MSELYKSVFDLVFDPCSIYNNLIIFFRLYYTSFTFLAFRGSHCSYLSSSLSALTLSIQHVSYNTEHSKKKEQPNKIQDYKEG